MLSQHVSVDISDTETIQIRTHLRNTGHVPRRGFLHTLRSSHRTRGLSQNSISLTAFDATGHLKKPTIRRLAGNSLDFEVVFRSHLPPGSEYCYTWSVDGISADQILKERYWEYEPPGDIGDSFECTILHPNGYRVSHAEFLDANTLESSASVDIDIQHGRYLTRAAGPGIARGIYQFRWAYDHVTVKS